MTEKGELLQWHSAFYAGIQIELEEEAEHLIFESEHTLSTKPMQIDVLIIKKNTNRKIKKNIGRLFRKYNIVEYKSPDDYLSIDDFYKVYGYTCFYKSDARKVDEIKAEELTITFACSRYPRDLFRYLNKSQNMILEQQEKGIYYLEGAQFPMQFLVTSELPEETNLWLRSLTNRLSECSSAEKLIREYEKHQKDTIYSSVMEIIVQANVEKFSEVRQMCNALRELMKDEFEKTREEGSLGKLEEQIRKKVQKGKTPEQIADDLEENVETILPIYHRVVTE